LLESGADINAAGGKYCSTLQASLCHRWLAPFLEFVRMLLAKGADVNMQGGFYGTALQAVAFKGWLDILEVL
ncbi:hypothetical protein JB92DRAFT_2735035, partial [Gautieria morchelliformis]